MRVRLYLWLVSFSLACATVSLPASPARAGDVSGVSAADRDTARKLLDEGDALFEAKDYRAALTKYRAADDLMKVPTTALELGKAHEAVGELVEARDLYLRATRWKVEGDNDAFRSAITKAKARAAALKRRVPSLVLALPGLADGVTADVNIDGKAVNAASTKHGRRVNPGAHVVTVRAPGYRPATAQVTLAEGENKRVVLQMEIDPNAPAEPASEGPQDEHGGSFPVWATVGFAVGAAGLVLGGVTGGLSLGKEGELADACNADGQCSPDLESTHDDATLLANLSNAGFIIGGVGVAFGIIALFTLDADDSASSDDTASVSIEPLLAPGYLGLRGRY